jgi:lipopolysaccharide transport system ATP-binding protein
MSDVAIAAEGLSKRYLIGHRKNERYVALRDIFGRELRNFSRKAADLFRGRQIVQGDEVEEFWALKDVSFQVERGEVLGVIGRNGSGKSTLLKILSRITEPTAGRAVLRGRIASLLEVGTGFHPELTGRENIFLNGAILGMNRGEVLRKFDEIVEFSELAQFLDTPVKQYSSGMYVRLAFAIAAHIQPEILIVDEVLAVGDADFQRKCLGKMESQSRSGATVLFVSHNMSVVEQICHRAMLLNKGKIIGYGAPNKQVQSYLGVQEVAIDETAFPRKISDGVSLEVFRFSPSNLMPGEISSLSVEVASDGPNVIHDLVLLIYNAQGIRVAISDLKAEAGVSTFGKDHPIKMTLDIEVPFVEGDYFVGLHLNCEGFHNDIRDLAKLTVHGTSSGLHRYEAKWRGVVELKARVLQVIQGGKS